MPLKNFIPDAPVGHGVWQRFRGGGQALAFLVNHGRGCFFGKGAAQQGLQAVDLTFGIGQFLFQAGALGAAYQPILATVCNNLSLL